MPEAVYYAVLGALAAAQVVEPELALVIAAGHLVASRAHHPAVQEAGEAAEAA
jgi:hypothetical protein